MPSKEHRIYSSRGINPHRLDAVLRHAGRSVLDVGCGNGAYVLTLADRYDIRGIDHEHFDSWNQNASLFSLSDATVLKADEASVDTILSFECLEHLPKPADALREYHRVTRQNLILTVPNCDITPGMRNSHMTYFHWTDRTHVNFFTQRTLASAIEEAGFRIVQNTLINKVAWSPLLREVFGLPRLWPARISLFAGELIDRYMTRPYYMTCLVVAEKT